MRFFGAGEEKDFATIPEGPDSQRWRGQTAKMKSGF
jgi:hypothetical protein